MSEEEILTSDLARKLTIEAKKKIQIEKEKKDKEKRKDYENLIEKTKIEFFQKCLDNIRSNIKLGKNSVSLNPWYITSDMGTKVDSYVINKLTSHPYNYIVFTDHWYYSSQSDRFIFPITIMWE